MKRQNAPDHIQMEPSPTRFKSIAQSLWRRLIEPSAKIAQPDQRRQAALLSAFLLVLICLAIIIEAITDVLSDLSTYSGYWATIISVVILLVIYRISRTQYLQISAALTVIILSLAVFLTGWVEPSGVMGGLFDFLILPLWMGSLFIDLKKLALFIISILAGLLLFPFLVPQITLNSILIGPFSFILTTSILLMVITHNRNRLEQDRQAEISAKEQKSRHEAARAEALLRVTDRLNAQLDMEKVLSAIGEEVALALNTPVSAVTLFDREQDQFSTAAGIGLIPPLLNSLMRLPRPVYDEIFRELGPVFTLTDLQAAPNIAYLVPFKTAKLRSIAFTRMEYARELVGSISVLTIVDQREFTKDELLLLRGIADQAALALVNTRLYKDARRRLEHLQALHTIDIAISTNRDLRDNLNVLLNKITEQLNVDAAVFLLLDENKQQLEFATSLGFRTATLRFTRLRLGEGMAGNAALQKKIIQIEDLCTDPQTLAYAPSLAKEGFVSYFAAPLISQGMVKGVLEIFHRTRLNPDDEWLNFLEALAGQAAIAIESTTLFEDLQDANDDLSMAYDSTIEGWSHALDLRDEETEGHTQRVTEMTVKLARAMGLDGDELIHVRRGALLHDIGKMGVPDGILLKPDKLSEAEWDIMRKHPQFAYELISPIAYLRPAIDIPYCHHEKWDGSGYPRGLSGEQIPFAARLFAVVDVWDALCSDRPYRKGWPEEKVIEHIRANAGTHFEPQVVEAFIILLNSLK